MSLIDWYGEESRLRHLGPNWGFTPPSNSLNSGEELGAIFDLPESEYSEYISEGGLHLPSAASDLSSVDSVNSLGRTISAVTGSDLGSIGGDRFAFGRDNIPIRTPDFSLASSFDEDRIGFRTPDFSLASSSFVSGPSGSPDVSDDGISLGGSARTINQLLNPVFLQPTPDPSISSSQSTSVTSPKKTRFTGEISPELAETTGNISEALGPITEGIKLFNATTGLATGIYSAINSTELNKNIKNLTAAQRWNIGVIDDDEKRLELIKDGKIPSIYSDSAIKKTLKNGSFPFGWTLGITVQQGYGDEVSHLYKQLNNNINTTKFVKRVSQKNLIDNLNREHLLRKRRIETNEAIKAITGFSGN